MSSLHTLIIFCSDENLHICLFKLWFVNLKILWSAFCYFVLLHLVTTSSHHFNDESNYYCFFLAAFVSMVSDANLIWQLVMSKHEMGCWVFGPAFVSMIPHCAHIFSLTRCFFVCFFQCTARKCFSTLPTLAASSTSSCSSPEARHYNLRSKHAKRSAKARLHFFRPNSLVCHAKSCCFFVSILRSSYPTF